LNIYLIHNEDNSDKIRKFATSFTVKKLGNIQILDISQQINSFNVEHLVKLEKEIVKKIWKVDAVLCECSKSSEHLSLVYSAAKSSGTPLFILRENTNTSIELTSSSTFKVFECTYSLADLKGFTGSFVENLKKILTKKFILTIKPEINAYLEWKSDRLKRIYKAEIVRNFLTDKIKSDEEYQKFIKS
jgi:hypothetical protein